MPSNTRNLVLLLLDPNGVGKRKNKFVFARERTARGNANAQSLSATAIHFEQLARTSIQLLAHASTKFHLRGLTLPIRTNANGLRPDGKNYRAVALLQRPAQSAL